VAKNKFSKEGKNMHHSSKTFGLLLSLLLAVCLFGHIAQAKYGGGGTIASAETSTYVFVPDQSKLVQTGGIASVHWTYSIKGQFQLTVDPNVGAASFARVDANATDDSPFKRTLDLNHVFNMTSLAGTVEPSGSINFTGKASDDSDVRITVTLQDNLAHLIGQTTPPPNSADFFIFSLDAVAQRKYGGGSGTAEDPYQIATAADLVALGDSPDDYDKHFILTADIDLAGHVFDKAVIAPDANTLESDFQGIPFVGVFDGNGHTISHLTITGKDYVGLFGQLGYGAEVKDVRVADANITGSGGYYVGALAGYNLAAVTRCYSTGAVTGSGDVGGLVGLSGGNVTNCYSTGAVSGSTDVGGLVGYMPHGSIAYCYSACTVRGDAYVGGLVGANALCMRTICRGGLINDCYSTSTVKGTSSVGGLVGWNEGDVTRCYGTGTVSGTGQYVGGLVGDGWPGGVTVSLWDTETSGQATSAGGTEETTAEMQMAKTFLEAGWDFVNIWGIGENQTYPYLRKYSAADINQDASVNFLDLAVLAENWLTDISHR
jgi:hypothetical protein